MTQGPETSQPRSTRRGSTNQTHSNASNSQAPPSTNQSSRPLNYQAPAFVPRGQNWHPAAGFRAAQHVAPESGPPPGFSAPPGLLFQRPQGSPYHQAYPGEVPGWLPGGSVQPDVVPPRVRGRGAGLSGHSHGQDQGYAPPGIGRPSNQAPSQRPLRNTVHSSSRTPDTGVNSSSREAPDCCVCFEKIEHVSIGACNHMEVCAMCSVRMRQRHNNSSCPLCKTDLYEILITPWRERLPRWDVIRYQLRKYFHNSNWVSGVYVDDFQHAGVPKKTRQLSKELMAKSGKICAICDEAGEQPFPDYSSLLQHMRQVHDRDMCPVCLMGLGLFPAEQKLYTTVEFQDHIATHPRCQLCKRVFADVDQLTEHIHLEHELCYICASLGRELVFSTTADLLSHLQTDHHPCPYPDCQEMMVAFSSRRQLEEHTQFTHGGVRLSELQGVLPQHSQGRRRGVPPRNPQSSVEEQVIERFATQLEQLNTEQPGSQEETLRQRQRLRSLQAELTEVRQARTRMAQQLQQQAVQSLPYLQGLRMIDDDYGMTGEAFPGGAPQHGVSGNQQDREELEQIISRDLVEADDEYEDADPSRGIELSQLQRGPREAFPALPGSAPVAAPVAPRPAPTAPVAAFPVAQAQPQITSRYARLVPVPRKCPCGRRTDRPVVREGAEITPLQCDDSCAAAARRAQLADAFGIADPDSHVAVVDRSRLAVWSAELLAFAHSQQSWVADVEKSLALFVRSKDVKRDWPTMPKTQRKIVHEMAPSYGLTTQSYGQEPSRYLRLFKGSNAGVPNNLLSATAGKMTDEEIWAALSQEQTFFLKLTDVHPSADVPRMFARWSADCSVEGPDTAGNATVTFHTEAIMREAAAAIGGGVRGKFRLDRSTIPSTR